MNPQPVHLAIVGAGAAGLFAAATAAHCGIPCLLVERKARVGTKMLMTANGRCNFSKDLPPARFLADLGEPAATFARHAIKACPPSAIAAALRDCGLRIRRMDDGRLFPASGKAADVVHVFGDLLRDASVPLLANSPVSAVARVPGGFEIRLPSFSVLARNVLVATGGLSFPKTGSVGDGQAFARSLGLRVEPCRPGLVGVDAPVAWPARFAGARFETGASAAVLVDGRETLRRSGEIEFEPRIVSGAAVYDCTRWVARHSPPRWSLRLDTPAGSFTLDNPSPRPLKEAIVTVGGVSLDEIDPLTMESRKIPGLRFAGEVLDLDGPTGGYNLTLAFATAALAVTTLPPPP